MLFASFILTLMTGCEEKKEAKTIITTRPVEVVKKDTIKMERMDNTSNVKWKGSQYNIIISRYPDEALSLTEDESENKYYDNRVMLKILHSDGTVFLKREFLKSDFKEFVSDESFQKKALVGFVFNTVDKGCLKFAASVGSPDKFSDDFIPFDVVVSQGGEMSIKLTEQNLIEVASASDTVK